MNEVPEPPEQDVVSDESQKRLKEWIEYFKNLSSRVKIITNEDENFVKVLSDCKKCAIAIKLIEKEEHLLDWPLPEKVAFIVKVDSSKPGQKPFFHSRDARVFCFGNIAFGLDYFEWDGDPEGDYWVATYSLDLMTEKALSWSYVASLIKSKLEKIASTSVPEFKEK